MLLCDGHSVGLRRDLNGVLLLDTALQTPISKSEDVIRVELPLPEVSETCGESQNNNIEVNGKQ